ncbi:MAG: LPS export ABC transporter periplasmic protein LptC [Candidatus Omnitrophica bacterium]|nr:LPS export ABC transporter periplasmic protein LptC [Candidatus Omnitrophota bacterium]
MKLSYKYILCAAAAWLIAFPFFVENSYAETLSSKEPVVVNGDHVEYLQNEKQVIGTGNVSITYKDIVLTCDRIEVNLATHDTRAEGNVNITQKGAYFIGDKIDYNFETRAAVIDYGYINARPFYFRAESLSKIAGKDEFGLTNGNLTTCDLDRPHYRIQAERVKIYLDDKVVANNVVFYVGDLPIFMLPYYVQPLGDDKKSHITVIPGESKEWGYYALTAYRYYFDDKFRGDVLVDYRSKLGLGVGVNHYMDTKVGDGAFKVYYTQENNNLAFEKTGAVETRYRYQYRHKWDIKDTDTTAIVEFNYLSDPDIIREYFYREYEELGANPDSYVSLITAKPDYTTEFLIRKRFNNFYTVVERLPEYKIDILNYRIGDTQFYYSGNASAVYLNQTYATSPTPQKDVNTARFDIYNQISYAARFFKSLSVMPYAGIRETYYSRNKWGNTNQIRTIFNQGVDLSTKFYKVYEFNTDYLGLDINKLRHIITPTAGYRHVHQPTISPDNLTQYDGIDSLDTENGVTLSLENKLQTKRKSGEQMTSVDLLRFIVSTDYLFRLEKRSIDLKSNKFNGIDFKLELIPYSWLYISSDMHVNTKTSLVETMNVDFVAGDSDKWSLSAGQRYYSLPDRRVIW